MADMKALYQEVIMDHNKKPRNYGKLSPCTHHAEGHNPLCGDHISLTMNMDGDKVESIGFEGEACAICKSSTSLMTVAVKGKSRSEAEEIARDFLDMTTGKLDRNAPNKLARLTVFAGVREYPARVKCASLAWHTLKAAVDAPDVVVSTE